MLIRDFNQYLPVVGTFKEFFRFQSLRKSPEENATTFVSQLLNLYKCLTRKVYEMRTAFSARSRFIEYFIRSSFQAAEKH